MQMIGSHIASWGTVKNIKLLDAIAPWYYRLAPPAIVGAAMFQQHELTNIRSLCDAL